MRMLFECAAGVPDAEGFMASYKLYFVPLASKQPILTYNYVHHFSPNIESLAEAV